MIIDNLKSMIIVLYIDVLLFAIFDTACMYVCNSAITFTADNYNYYVLYIIEFKAHEHTLVLLYTVVYYVTI